MAAPLCGRMPLDRYQHVLADVLPPETGRKSNLSVAVGQLSRQCCLRRRGWLTSYSRTDDAVMRGGSAGSVSAKPTKCSASSR